MKNTTKITLVLLLILFGVAFLNTPLTVLNHLPEIILGIYLGLLVKSFKKTFS